MLSLFISELQPFHKTKGETKRCSGGCTELRAENSCPPSLVLEAFCGLQDTPCPAGPGLSAHGGGLGEDRSNPRGNHPRPHLPLFCQWIPPLGWKGRSASGAQPQDPAALLPPSCQNQTVLPRCCYPGKGGTCRSEKMPLLLGDIYQRNWFGTVAHNLLTYTAFLHYSWWALYGSRFVRICLALGSQTLQQQEQIPSRILPQPLPGPSPHSQAGAAKRHQASELTLGIPMSGEIGSLILQIGSLCCSTLPRLAGSCHTLTLAVVSPAKGSVFSPLLPGDSSKTSPPNLSCPKEMASSHPDCTLALSCLVLLSQGKHSDKSGQCTWGISDCGFTWVGRRGPFEPSSHLYPMPALGGTREARACKPSVVPQPMWET